MPTRPPGFSSMNLYSVLSSHMYSHLSLIAPVRRSPRRYVVWLCQCTCGAQVEVESQKIQQGLRRYCSRSVHWPDGTLRSDRPAAVRVKPRKVGPRKPRELVYVEFWGDRIRLVELFRSMGIGRAQGDAIRGRLASGWAIERALEVPVRRLARRRQGG